MEKQALFQVLDRLQKLVHQESESLQFLSSYPLDQTVLDDLKQIISKNSNLKSLLSDLGDFYKLFNGNLDLVRRKFSLLNILQSFFSNEYHFDSIPKTILGDPGRWRQFFRILQELCSEKEQGLSLHFMSEDINQKSRLSLSIKGEGIERLEKEGDFHFLLLKKLCLALSGTYQKNIQSSDEIIFSFDLELPDSSPINSFSHSGLVKNTRVLILDSDLSLYQNLKDWFYEKKIECRHLQYAADGKRALVELAQPNSQDLIVILEQNLFDQSAFHLISDMIELAPFAKFILVTSEGERGDAQKAQAFGFHAYLSKPIKDVDLIQVMKLLKLRGDREKSLITRFDLNELENELNVLILADENSKLSEVEHVLQKEGCNSLFVSIEEDFVKALKDHDFDLLLFHPSFPLNSPEQLNKIAFPKILIRDHGLGREGDFPLQFTQEIFLPLTQEKFQSGLKRLVIS